MTPRYLYPSLVTHRTLARLLVAAVGLLTGALLGAAPAAAHATLKLSDPAVGSTIQALPEVVRLTFSETLTAVPTVTVRDDAGTVINSGPLTPRGTTVLQPVKSPKGGRFTVTWDVLSADGHKASGSFEFTVAAPAQPQTDAPPSDAASDTESGVASGAASGVASEAASGVVVTGTPQPSATDSTASSAAAAGGDGGWLLWTVVAVVVLGAAVTVVLLRRRRPSA